MKRYRTPVGIMAAVLFGTISAIVPQAASAHVSIQIEAALPGLFLPMPQRPPMVWLPNIGIYVANGTREPIFYREGRYYVRHSDRWYASPNYGGPWVGVRPGMLPPPLRRYRNEDWRRYQRDADERFRRDRGPDRPAPFYPRYQDRGEHRGWDRHPQDRRGPDGYGDHHGDRGNRHDEYRDREDH
ncbi:MAG: hypothetical protein ACYDB8_05525 [Acidiferrobacterales bacterium]